MNRWNEIALSLQDLKAKQIPEDDYHKEIENLLRILGWSRHNGSLVHKQQIPIGSQKEIEADIVLAKEEKKVAIEVKHPNNKIKKRQILQLASYMRQIKTAIGIYIGEKICIFYDDPNEDNLVCCMEIPLEQNHAKGLFFCEMLTFGSFSYESLLHFCSEEYKKIMDRKKLSDLFMSWQMNSDETAIKQILANHFISLGVHQDIVKEQLEKLSLFSKSKGVDRRLPLPGEYCVKKESTRFRRYRLNKGSLEFKRDIVQSVIENLIRQKPQITFFELTELFRNVKCGRKLFLTVEELRDKSKVSKDVLGRYNCSESDILSTGDGIDFVVCNQWAESNFPSFVTIVKEKLRWEITPE